MGEQEAYRVVKQKCYNKGMCQGHTHNMCEFKSLIKLMSYPVQWFFHFEGLSEVYLHNFVVLPCADKALAGQFGQPKLAEGMLKGSLKNGFFIEAGAFDGIHLSNSLLFELRNVNTNYEFKYNRKWILWLLPCEKDKIFWLLCSRIFSLDLSFNEG